MPAQAMRLCRPADLLSAYFADAGKAGSLPTSRSSCWIMTVACMFLGLVPIMWSVGAGADVMKRIAAPMIGGIFTSFLLELLVYPAIYEVWKWHFELKPELARSSS